MATPSETGTGFAAFFRRYTKTWLHALAAAALTGFGMLAIFHRGFVALAVASYVFPPIVLYITRSPLVVPPGEATGPRGADPGGGPETTSNDSGDRTEETNARSVEANARSDGTNTQLEADDRSVETEEQPKNIAEQPVKTDGPPGKSTGSNEAATYWRAATVPTATTLFDVTVAGGSAFAVGADGVIIADDGDGWQTAFTDGPGAGSNTLRGVDATGDGDGVWVAGDGGAVARLDGTTGRHVDFAAPRDRTDTWEEIAVGGVGDDELVLLANGSGEILRGRYRDGEVGWDTPVKPGSGSSLSGVDLASDTVGHACDTNDEVFETTDGGETFRRIGVGSTDGTLTDVASGARGDCTVSDDDGVLHGHASGTWTRLRLGDDPLEAVAIRDEYGVACGGTVVHERASEDADWNRYITSVDGPLLGIAAGPTRAVAVGRDGAVVERTSRPSRRTG